MYRVTKSIEVASAHMLSKNAGKCKHLHGHTRKIEVTLERDELNADDMVCDFAILKRILLELTEPWDHALLLNSEDKFAACAKTMERVELFDRRDPTSEVLAAVLFNRLEARLPELGDGVRLARVKIWESPDSSAEFAP